MRRRHFLELSAALITGSNAQTRIPLRFFTEQEARIVDAATERILPADESGPGAREAGVVIYIDRQLAGPYGRDRYRYTKPPFEDGPPGLGYQGPKTPRQIYREGLKILPGFDALPTPRQDEALKQIESSLFFRLLRIHTIEGMFSDPMHGGNRGLAGWKLVGFPGPHMSYLDDVETHYGEAFRPKIVTLRDVTGRNVRPSEDLEE